MKTAVNILCLLAVVLLAAAPAGAEEKFTPEQIGGTLRGNFNAEPKTLNPLTSKDVYATIIQDHIFESLIERDFDTMEWKPLLADRWEVSPDSKVITFHLDPRATFSDGTPVTADDVVFTYQTIINPGIDARSLASYFEDCQDCVKVDDRTVRFIWKKAYFKSLEFSALAPLPKHVYQFKNPKEFNDINDKLVGTGPYVLKEWKTGQQIVLARNEHYWRYKPSFDKIVYNVILESQASVQALKAGELDDLALSAEWYIKLQKDPEVASKFQLLRYTAPGNGYGFIGWNNARPPFDDKRVRRAMTELIWREQLLKYLHYDIGLLMTGPFWPKSPQYDKTVKAWPFSREGALALLKEAGWEDRNGDGWLENAKGERFSFELSYPGGDQDTRDFVRVLREEFRRVGIEMNERAYTWAVFGVKLDNRDFDAVRLGWGGGGVEEDPYQIWHSTSIAKQGSNFVSFRNAETDRLIETARATLDETQRNDLYHQFHRIIHEEQPYTFLWSAESLRAVSNRIKGVKVHPMGMDWREWWVGKEEAAKEAERSVRTYILKRLLLMIPTLVGMTLLVYAVVRLAPGDPIEAMIRNQSGNIDPKAMRESADRIRDRLGLNDINLWGDDVESHLPDLKSADPAVRTRAAAELARITHIDINQVYEPWNAWWSEQNRIATDADPLVKDLESSDEKTRTEALEGLRKLTDRDLKADQWAPWLQNLSKEIDDTEPLVQKMRGIDDEARIAAAAELRKRTGEDFTASPEAWQAWWDGNKYTFGKTLIDPAEKVVNIFYGYGRWVYHMFHGDFGESLVFRMPKNSPVVGALSSVRNFFAGLDVGEAEKQVGLLKSSDEKARTEAMAALRQLTGRDLGADPEAWAAWWKTFLDSRSDMGKNVDELRANGSRNPFWLICDRIPVTFILNLIAEILIFVIAMPVGLAAARRQGGWFDRGSSFVLLALWSIPVVLAGSLLLGFLGKGGQGASWFPVVGLHAPGSEKFGWLPYLGDLTWHCVLPVTCLVYGSFAYLAKLGRASLLENIRADYVRTARAKGLSERRVIYHHALRNSLLPMITTMVLTLPGLLGGSVVVETIFSVQGTGILFVNAAQAYDLSVLMAEVLLYGFLTLLFLLIGDILYAWADPRVRYE